MESLSDSRKLENGPQWMVFAMEELHQHVHEFPGQMEHNLRIIEYHSATSLRASDDETPWCSSFVNWCFLKSRIIGTNSVAARSWLKWGRALEEPSRGCVVVLKRGTNTALGHVGFYVGEDFKNVLLLGGNQNNQVRISSYRKDDVIGYRWPMVKDYMCTKSNDE